MRAICLSLVPILRCETLSRLESIVLVVPTAIEVLVCLLLLVTRGCDRKHILLLSEGLTYFSLVLLDLLMHIIPSISKSLTVFRPLDILTGAASSISLLMYTLFLFIFMNTEFIPTLAEPLQELAKYALLFFIPLIAAANELGSFVNISYRSFGRSLAVGFTDEAVHTGFDILTLALLTSFQLLVFAIVADRLVKAFAYRRDIEAIPAKGGDDVKAHLFRGLGWIVGGVLVGVGETALGFAGGGFAIAITRRTLRMLGRALLVIGAINGVDTVEDFRILKFEAQQERRRSKLLGLISNPRNSTFKQVGGYRFDPEAPVPRVLQNRWSAISATASDILAEIRTVSVRASGSGLPPAGSSGQATENAGSTAYSGMVSADSTDSSRRVFTRPGTPPLLSLSSLPRIQRPERVTVLYARGRAPILELRRFSDFDTREVLSQIDSFVDPYNMRAKSLPLQGWRNASRPRRSLATTSSFATPISRQPSNPPPSTVLTDNPIPSSGVIPQSSRSDLSHARYTYAGGDRNTQELLRQVSSRNDSLELLHSLTMQFPGIPQRPPAFLDMQQMPVSREVPGVSRVSTTSGKTVRDDFREQEPVSAWYTDSIGATEEAALNRGNSIPRSKASVKSDRTPEEEIEVRSSQETGASTLVEEHLAQILEHKPQVEVAAGLPTPVSFMGPVVHPPKAAHKHAEPTNTVLLKSLARPQSAIVEKARPDMDATDPPNPPFVESSPKSGSHRIVSIGSAPRRLTPTPNSSVYTRSSIAIELDQTPGTQLEIPVKRSPRRSSRKLKKQSIRRERAQSSASDATRSVFED